MVEKSPLYSLQLNPDSDISLIAQLTQQITWLIASGELREGERLPPMRELAEQLGVHMHTVRQAYQRLEANSLVSIRTRRGTVVLPHDPEALAGVSTERTSRLIGVILPNPVSFYTPYVRTIQREALERGYFPIFCYTYDNPYLVETYFNQLLSRHVDGFIITSLFLPSLVENPHLLEKYPPIVSADMPDMPGYRILIDTEGGAYQVTKHLLEHGRKRVGLVTPPLEWPNVAPFFQGYQKAIEESGLEIEPQLVARVEGFFGDQGREGAERLLALDQPPEAIVAAADTLALGAMEAIKQMGLKIPEDVALAGYNDIDAASFVQPGLTTASVPAAEMGSLALDTLMKLIEGKKPQRKNQVLSTELVIRRSCGC